ncbi:MAG TPA: MFS transporter [Mycobacteriales bacterium]|nr:MFS transporter [Mycobacteriales bacterium]
MIRSHSDSTGFNRKLIAPMIVGALLNPVNSSIIAVSLVPIGRAFGAPSAQTAWLISSLYLATAIGQPVVGRLVDTFGPRRLFLAGCTLTGIAGLIGTVAPNLAVLVVARVILGFGTCAGYPAAMYLIRSESERTGIASPSNVLTALAVAGQTISVIGPTAGGLLIGLGGWRTTFAINLPLAAIGLYLGARRLPKAESRTGKSDPIDIPGILLFGAMLTCLLLYLMSPDVGDLYLLALTAAAAIGLTVRELRVADPFIDLRLLGGNIPLLATYTRNLLAMTVSYAFLYGFTQWLEDSRDLSASQAGLTLLPMSMLAIVVSSLTGRRPEIRGKLIVGAATQLIACCLLLLTSGSSAIWLLLLLTLILGIPQGLNNLANQNAVYHQADPARIASSAGLLRTFMYLGAIIASAANGAFFGHRASTTGMHHLAVFLIVIAGLFLLLTLIDRSLARVGRESDPAKGNTRAHQHDRPTSSTHRH